MGEEAFKTRLAEAESASRRWQEMELQEIPIGYQALQIQEEKEEPSDDRYEKGKRILKAGAIMTAGGWLLIGIALAGGPETVLFSIIGGLGVIAGVTVGPITMMVALVVLLVQALKGPQ